eukprot:2188633-Rhodomonas_salina.1
MSRTLEQSLAFETTIHAQPRFSTFAKSLMLARLNNVRVVHLAGHGEKDAGFYFLKDKQGMISEPVRPETVSAVIGSQASSKAGGT